MDGEVNPLEHLHETHETRLGGWGGGWSARDTTGFFYGGFRLCDGLRIIGKLLDTGARVFRCL